MLVERLTNAQPTLGGHTVGVDHRSARALLGLGNDVDDQAIRAAHRQLIRSAHPDMGGSTAAAAELNQALHLLLHVPEPAPTAPPPPSAASTATADGHPDDVDRYFVLDDPPDDLLVRLMDAGHSIGEVVFVDPHAGLLEIVVGVAPAVGQLAVTVGDPGAGGTPVSFTLDALGITPAPPIADVVDALMAELSARR
ncbi:MAG: hypothetical protein ACI9C1_002256 [Candidatus Aldehydirespiratoraceae bacterium]